MVDGCGTGGVGTKPRPLLSIEVSSLVKVQQIYTVVIVFYLIWSLFMLIIMIVPTKSTRFLTDNFQRIFILVTWA